MTKGNINKSFLLAIKSLIAFGFLFLPRVSQAQPDEAYIQKLTGQIDTAWLQSAGQSVSIQPLQWQDRKAPGFSRVAQDARKQALLSQPWQFYPVETSGTPSEPTEVQLPHRFEKERDYKSGWYMTKFQIDQPGDKRYILMLNRVQMFCIVYVNGKPCGQHFGAYTPFEVDMSAALQTGENVIAIFVYDQSATVEGNKVYNQISYTRLRSIYNPNAEVKELPGGISDIPILEVRAKTHIKDIFVKTSTRKNELAVEVELPTARSSAPCQVSFALLSWPDGEPVDLTVPGFVTDHARSRFSSRTAWPNPKLWSPDHPNLYVLRTTLKSEQGTDVLETRFGFREFWVEGQSFMLNGTPIRLRGESYYFPILPGRDFHRELFKTHKQLFGANACRLHAFMPPVEVIYGADEAGVLLIDQSAIWSENASYYKNGGDWFLKNVEKEFEEWARRDRNCPSAVIWDVENEMLRVSYEEHLPWVKQLPAFIEKFDTTRPFNNSGQGWFNPDQDMVLLHMQEHYSKIMADWKARDTRPLIMGEFWVGGRMERRIPTSPEFVNSAQRYLAEAQVYEDYMLEMRYRGVSGVMPFRISRLAFLQPRSAEGCDFTPPDQLNMKIRSDAVVQKIKHGLQPVSIFFWPRQNYIAAEGSFKRELVICNDAEEAKELTVSWAWDNRERKRKIIHLQQAEQHRIPIDEIPPAGAGNIVATVSSDQQVLSTDTLRTPTIPSPAISSSKPIRVYKDQKLTDTLTNLGLQATSSESIPRVKENLSRLRRGL